MKKAMNRRAFGKAAVAVAGGAVASGVGVDAGNRPAGEGVLLPKCRFPASYTTVNGGVVYVVFGAADEVWRVDMDGETKL